jgi:uncharacterized repeat protein (TIGR01451 family)
LTVCAGIATAALTRSPGVPLVQGATKVTICHATSSEKNRYVQISVDDDSIVTKNGHGEHPDDIIPPFDYVDQNGGTQHYPGKNWDDAGRATWENGCNVPPPAPTPLPIQPVVKCVDDNGSTFTAVFGYSNPNAAEVTVAIGAGNSFAPGPDRGQPETFTPGTVESAVTVTESAGAVTWDVTYGGVTSSATATASFPNRCSTEPAPGPAAIEIFVMCVDNTDGSFNATFGYDNRGAETNVPLGDANRFSPEPANRGQPTTFEPGNHASAFTVTGIPNGTNLTWTLTSDTTRNATATASFEAKCTAPPTPTPLAISVTCIQDHGATFDATFGYLNPTGAPVSIPAGPDNNVLIGDSPGSGQPTTFDTGTVTNAFTVTRAPAASDVTWSVTYSGVKSVAVANEAFPTHCGVNPPDPSGPYRIGVFVSCVTTEGSTYSATFGYSNDDTQANTVPVGDENRFSPAPENRGQPTTFEPGNHEKVFTVSGIPAGTSLIWSVTSDTTRTAEASASFEPKCNPDPPPAELVPIGLFVSCVINHASTYDAVFGYTNDNRAEQIVPLGIENTFLPAPGNRGQPTTFEPGTVRNAVTVTGIPNDAQVIWTVSLGAIRAAVASRFVERKCNEPPQPPTPPPPNPKPPEAGLFATCVLRQGVTTTYDAIFGYANASGRNAIIPVGRRNLVAPAPINRGQPTVFRPGIVLNAFTVKNIPRRKSLTWAVRLPNGDVRTTTASARFPRNCITAPPPPSADLVLTKSAGDTSMSAGQRGTYTIHVVNRGPNIALRVRIADVIDPRLELLSASTTRGSCRTSGQRVSCTIAALPPGAVVTVLVAIRARGAGTIRNVAVVTHSRRDPTPRNNVDTALITVTGRTGAVSPAYTG